jgi:hypothetical protein
MMARPAIQAEAVVSSDIDTQSEIVPTPPPGVSPPDPRHRWWAIPLVVVSAVALVVVLVASVLPASLVAETTCAATNDECTPQPAPYARVPSSAEPVEDRISFDAVPRYPSDGSLLFVTVREPPLTLLDAFAGTKERDAVLLACWTFSGTMDVLHSYVPVSDATRLDAKNYRASGSTALYDISERLHVAVVISCDQSATAIGYSIIGAHPPSNCHPVIAERTEA